MKDVEAIKFLESKRVFLRPIEKEDIDIIYRHTLWEKEGRRLTGTKDVFTYTKVQQFYENAAVDSSRMDLLICLQETNEPIGDLAMMDIDHQNQHAVVRISIFDPTYLGNGYGTEALSLLLEYGFDMLNLNRIGLDVFAFNERAIKAYKKLGFQQEGRIREALFYNGEYHDSIIMGVLRNEFVRDRQ